MINATQFSSACELAELFDGWRNASAAVVTAVLSTDAIMISAAPLVDPIHTHRSDKGQIAVAQGQRAIMEGLEICRMHRDGDSLVQDPYCIHCQPQITGAALDLPPVLTGNPGLNSGFIVAGISSAARMCEKKNLANHCSTDTTLTSADQEDHVSMAARGSRRINKTNANLNMMLGVELACGCHGIGCRAPLKTSPTLEDVTARGRTRVKPPAEDRCIALDLQMSAFMTADGSLVQGLNMPAYILGRLAA